MKILVDREDLQNIYNTLRKLDDIEIGSELSRQIVMIENKLELLLGKKSESTFPVYHSCPQCGKTIYLTDPHKCYTEVVYENISR